MEPAAAPPPHPVEIPGNDKEAEEENQQTKSIVSLILGIGGASFFAVSSMPLFPDRRTLNGTHRIYGIPIIIVYILGTILIAYEAINWLSFVDYLAVPFGPKKAKSNPSLLRLLPLVFFVLYAGVQLYKFINEIVAQPGCHLDYGIWLMLAKVLYASVLLYAMRSQRKTEAKNASVCRYLRWTYLVGLNLITAMEYVIEEAGWDYVEAVEDTFKKGSKYSCAFNVTGYDRPVDYVPMLYKDKVRCMEHMLWGQKAHVILSALPASTEFFLLATCFCLFKWKNLGVSDKGFVPEQINNEGEHDDDDDGQSSNSNESDRLIPGPAGTSRCWIMLLSNLDTIKIYAAEAWQQRKMLLLILATITFTIYTTTALFLPSTLLPPWFHVEDMQIMSLTEVGRYSIVIYSQQTVLSLMLLVPQVIMYLGRLRKMEARVAHSMMHQLEIFLSIFPLLPNAIFLSLRVAPDILPLSGDKHPPDPFNDWQWALINLGTAGIWWSQTAFQSFFTSIVLNRIHLGGGMNSSRWKFLYMAVVNACLWVSISVESHRLGTHSRACHSDMYGVLTWVIVHASTLPVVLFYFAHSTTTFLEFFVITKA